ncbi:hypothetical protein JCM19233_1824 [Vibrio astriarenae]|nr:hypothetical protein JCM19233_1824 [Vibrio sp. C7]
MFWAYCPRHAINALADVIIFVILVQSTPFGMKDKVVLICSETWNLFGA